MVKRVWDESVHDGRFDNRLATHLIKSASPKLLHKLLGQIKQKWRSVQKLEKVQSYLRQWEEPHNFSREELALDCLMWYACGALWNEGTVRDSFGIKLLLRMRLHEADLFVRPFVGLALELRDKEHEETYIVAVPRVVQLHAVSWTKCYLLQPSATDQEPLCLTTK